MQVSSGVARLELMRTIVLAAASLLAFGSFAAADVIHLKNGRKLEGTIQSQRRDHVRLATPGGTLKVPKAMIKRIEEARSAKAELIERQRAVDPTDPKALDALASWAAKRGLGREAKDLWALATDLRFQRFMDAAKKQGTAEGYVRCFHFARRKAMGRDVQLYCLREAVACDADDPEVRTAFRQFESDIAEAEAAIKREQELAKRVRYVNPESERLKGKASYGDQVAARAVRAKRKAQQTPEQRQAELDKIKVSLTQIAPPKTARERAAEGRASYR